MMFDSPFLPALIRSLLRIHFFIDYKRVLLIGINEKHREHFLPSAYIQELSMITEFDEIIGSGRCCTTEFIFYLAVLRYEFLSRLTIQGF